MLLPRNPRYTVHPRQLWLQLPRIFWSLCRLDLQIAVLPKRRVHCSGKGHVCARSVFRIKVLRPLAQEYHAEIACCAVPQNVLSKLSASKELMKEILAREVKKQAEREAEKAARADAKVAAQASA